MYAVYWNKTHSQTILITFVGAGLVGVVAMFACKSATISKN